MRRQKGQRPALPGDRTGPSAVGDQRRLGLARRLSKLGICSRSEAERRIRAGRVSVGGRAVTVPEHPTTDHGPALALDGVAVVAVRRVYLMLNKPRGLTTSTADERGRETVYRCLDDPALPWLAPVGRLDRASEGLLLFSTDPQWAAGVSAGGGICKTYRVRLDRVAEASLIAAMMAGVSERGELLQAVACRLLGEADGQQRRWIEVVLDEGRNRHIRRMLAALEVGVERLIRVAVGELALGDLAKGQWRHLSAAEVASLRQGDVTG